MEELHSHSDPLKSDQISLQTHPKIKPLLRRYSEEGRLNETNYQKSLKMYSKTFRAAKTITDSGRDTSIRYIMGCTKDLKAQDSLTKLSYFFNKNACFENRYLFSKIRGLRNLSSLDMQFLRNIHQIPLKVLFKSLGYLKDLTHFKIELNCYGFRETDGQTLFTLFQSLRRLKQLKSLSLRFLMCANFNNGKMQLLPQYLSHLKQIQSLEVSFDRSTEFTDQDMISLASVLPKLPLLSQLSLDIGGQRRVIQGPTLVRIFKNMRSLSGITLKMGFSQIVKTESTDPLSEGLRLLHVPSLKRLNLHLNKDLDNEGLIELSQTIKRFTSLNTLQFELAFCETLTNDGIAEFSLALNGLTPLSSFNLWVHYLVEADSFIGCIASGLKSLHNLVNLKLTFAYVKCDQDQLRQLSASLANLNSLKFLDICLASIESLSDDIVEQLGESLLKLVQLKHLALNFSDSKTVTNQGVEALTNAVQELHGLSVLDLNFNANQEIDEKAVEKIAETLLRLPSLYTTRLRFSRCPKLQQNEKSLCSLFNALRQIKNIREVSLSLSQNETNEREVKNLKQRKIITVHWS